MRTVLMMCFVVTMTASAGASDQPSSTTVTTRSGRVSGVAGKDASILAFKGIPYAAPPVGNLRWREPQPHAAWTAVRTATEFGPSCPQAIVPERKPWTHEFMTQGTVSEDCLYLNVWTKSGFAIAKRPVLVFIHGGAFLEGSGAVPVYNGEGLAAKGLVVVTINYRLGILGFFTHPELTRESPHRVSGNYGLLDQVAALRWVRENIAAFGGDPHRVTIAGQSAGASSVHALTASPLAKNLFQRAIAESGSRPAGLGLMGDRKLADQEQEGARFAESKGFHTLAELRRASPEQIAAPPFRFGPVVDGWFLPAAVDAIFAAGDQNDVPTITGWTKDDIGVVSNPGTTLETFRQKAQQRFGDRAAAFLSAYPASTDEEARRAETESSRDQMRVAMYIWAIRRAKTAKTSAYTYYWDHAMPGPDAARFGAFHTSEVPYVMNTLSMSDRPFAEADFRIAAQASSYWINFAANGDPNGPDLTAWPPVRGDTTVTMEIGDATGVIPIASDSARLNFWRQEIANPQQ